VQILAVVVRYKVPLEESQTMQSLSKAFQEMPELAQSIRIFLWDNTPSPLISPASIIPLEYRHTGDNLGVSGAYNRAMEFAEANGIPWMLTLDQDTTLNASYLKRMLSLSHEVFGNPQVCSIVPFVRSHGRLVSPRRLGRLNRVFQIDRAASGILHADAYAINSASLMRISALREIGGYSEEFWLDLSDVYVFQRMNERGKLIFLAGNLEIEHSIAGMNFEQDMVPERYQVFLAAENLYLSLYRSRFENAFQTFRLLPRAFRQYLQYKNKAYAAVTWRCFVARLVKRRASLIDGWRDSLLFKRQIPTAGPASSETRIHPSGKIRR
jgi:GT2 family glycosyltransferase